MGKGLFPGLNLKNSIGLKKDQDSELCEVYVRGTPELISKIFRLDIEKEKGEIPLSS